MTPEVRRSDARGITRRRRVLVISAHFPPISGSQSVRAVKLLKYLPGSGWVPDIISVDEDKTFGSDPSLIRDVPQESEVVRIAQLGGLAGRTLRRLRTPDHLAAWILPAASVALGLVQRTRYEALLSFSFPASSHVAALLVHSFTGLPWLADFSDPWMNNPYRSGAATWSDVLSEWVERRVVVRASTLGFASTELREYEIGFHPEIEKKSFVTPNPAESLDFARLGQGLERDHSFTLVHAGSLYSIRQPRYLFEAFSRFRNRHPEADAKLRLVGSWSNGAQPRRELGHLGHIDGVIRVGSRTHEEALKEMVRADVLVVIDPSSIEPGIFMPLKLSEYLMSGRPILALTVPGPVTRFVERFAAGKAVRFDDVGAIEAALEQLYSESRPPSWKGGREIPELEARTAGRLLAEALTRVASHP